MSGTDANATRAYVPLLGALVPFALYVFTTGAHSYWLDSGEFTAVSVYLDIAHPPGHPLNALWSKLFCFLPLGPMPFRVALGQAVASCASLAVLSVAFARSLKAQGMSLRARERLSLAAVLALAGSHAYWFQSVRQEVYALQALFLAVSLERLCASATRDDDDPRPFYSATFALALGLANHHFVSVLGIPALGLELLRLTRAHGVRPWLVGLGLGLLGLSSYVYLPIRASTLPPIDLGHPVTLTDFFWVVSAQVYARRIGLDAPEPLALRFADLLILLVENVTFVGLALALLGLYFCARKRAHWRVLFVWGVTAAVSLLGRPWLGSVSNNPDVLGYMLPGFAALVALAALGAATIVSVLSLAPRRAELLWALTIPLALGQFVREHARSTLADFHATDDFDDARRRLLPEDSVLVLVTPESVFRHWDGEATEGIRPDITLVPVPFLGYGETGSVLAARMPLVGRLIEDYVANERLSVDMLRELAKEHTVLVEADTLETVGLLPYLAPFGPLYRVLPERVPAALIASGAALRAQVYGQLYASLGAQAVEPETARKLLWVHYTDALYYAFHGQRARAREAVAHGLGVAPGTRELVKLESALKTAASGPIDIRPFLVGD